ncbi:FAD-dependent oxidoreductase [Candidatus Marinimicrobia bacterium]|nr:FAD-dependent oxidoreductase [Candidatus Neomarinimicrobiota bacterium]
MVNKKTDIVIIGAGIAGLACAMKLKKNNRNFIIIEQSDRVGGRVGSIKENEYIFDLGFQVYNTEYYKTNSLLNLKELKLKVFKPGASIYNGRRFEILSDPFRDPSTILETFFSGMTTFKDKIKILTLKRALSSYCISEDQSEDMTTLKYLKSYGFSNKIINGFFKPFFSGIFLENQLETSSKFFKNVFSNFNKGYAAVPVNGMQAIPDQMVKNLNPHNLLLGNKVIEAKNPEKIVLENNEIIEAKYMVLTGGSNSLVNNHIVEFNSVRTFYFSSRVKVKHSKYINLFPYDSLINNIAILSSVSENYSPEGNTLFSITIIESDLSKSELIDIIQDKLSTYYGDEKSNYIFMKEINIKQATIKQKTGYFDLKIEDKKNILFAGDYTTYGSIEGAVVSGIKTAEKLISMSAQI